MKRLLCLFLIIMSWSYLFFYFFYFFIPVYLFYHVIHFLTNCFFGADKGPGKNRHLSKLCIGGGVLDETILEYSLGNHGRKQTADVVKGKEAGVEKSRNRTHCGVGEEWAAAREKKKRGNSVTTKGLMLHGLQWTFRHNTDGAVLCEEDCVVQSERSGIWRVKTRHPNCLFQQLAG